jgi:hypothetical protein
MFINAGGGMKKKYEPIGCTVETLIINKMVVKCKAGQPAEELLDKIESLIKRFSEEGDWVFSWSIE